MQNNSPSGVTWHISGSSEILRRHVVASVLYICHTTCDLSCEASWDLSASDCSARWVMFNAMLDAVTAPNWHDHGPPHVVHVAPPHIGSHPVTERPHTCQQERSAYGSFQLHAARAMNDNFFPDIFLDCSISQVEKRAAKSPLMLF